MTNDFGCEKIRVETGLERKLLKWELIKWETLGMKIKRIGTDKIAIYSNGNWSEENSFGFEITQLETDSNLI